MIKFIKTVFYSTYSPFLGVAATASYVGGILLLMILSEKYEMANDVIGKICEYKSTKTFFLISYYLIIFLNIYSFLLSIYIVKTRAFNRSVALSSLTIQFCFYMPIAALHFLPPD